MYFLLDGFDTIVVVQYNGLDDIQYNENIVRIVDTWKSFSNWITLNCFRICGDLSLTAMVCIEYTLRKTFTTTCAEYMYGFLRKFQSVMDSNANNISQLQNEFLFTIHSTCLLLGRLLDKKILTIYIFS